MKCTYAALANASTVGAVLGAQSDYDDGKTTIFTIHSFAITDTAKGAIPSPPLIEVRQRGGEVDGEVIGSKARVELPTGTNYVLFLRSLGSTTYEVYGGTQGRYTVSGGIVVETGQPLVERKLLACAVLCRHVVVQARQTAAASRAQSATWNTA